jgi:hypothetical protein
LTLPQAHNGRCRNDIGHCVVAIHPSTAAGLFGPAGPEPAKKDWGSVTESRWLEPLASEQADEETGPPEYEISTYPTDFTLQVLHQQWQEGVIAIPPFQRQFVWKQAQSSRLIESFLLGLPVPPVYFYVTKRIDQDYFEVE